MTDDPGVPLITVVTPTWRRHELLLGRCVPSVQAQDYPRVEHVIVSDGPDENLRDSLRSTYRSAEHRQDIRQGRKHPLWYYELPVHGREPHYGVPARLRALELAAGDLITYCDDDDELRPGHCRLLAAALEEHPDAGFAVSRMMCHSPHGKSVTGWGRLECGNVGSPMIMHRHEILGTATWRDAGLFEDWDLVERWLDAGIGCANVDAETSDVYPSRFWEEA